MWRQSVQLWITLKNKKDIVVQDEYLTKEAWDLLPDKSEGRLFSRTTSTCSVRTFLQNNPKATELLVVVPRGLGWMMMCVLTDRVAIVHRH
ncbi:hypothetical protein ACHQM5_005648 [Ranunculus cassubicifolius]